MNPKKEKLLNDTYDKFLKISMNKLPGKLLDGITAENIMAYGTTLDEKLLSIQDCRDLVDRQLKQGSGMKFRHERIPVAIIISPEEDSAIFVEELNLTIKSGKDTHRLFLRVTTALEYSDNKWKVVHFHTSKPDDAKSETDTWHIDEWKRKNDELQKLVNEKTADLKKKNRDLEIESSLERVRTVSMSMKKPEDLLNICETLFKELQALGFTELRNAMINIFNDADETFLNYDYSDAIGKSITPLFYDIHPIIKKQVKQVRNKRNSYSETVFSIKDLNDWKKFRKSRGEKDDPRLKKASSLHYYFYSIGTAAIGISTFSSITDEKRAILKRFRNVFDFSYRRYMDVTRAEEQARDAKIEASLERVRSRTMAMQKSDELSETTFVLFQQFRDLGETPDQITIGIMNEEEKVIEFWTTMDGNKVDRMVKFPIKETGLMRKLHAAWKKQERSLDIDIKGKELHDYIDYRVRLTGVKTKNDHLYDRRFIQAAFFSKGMITISTNNSPSKETLPLLERFAGVFDLTYTRFLDLKQAEAQTHEAKIELALERIRARSMAMHHSSELVDASVVLFNELKSLGIEAIRTGVGIIDEPNKSAEVWSSQLIEKERNKILGVVPFKVHPFFEGYYKSWKKRDLYFSYELSGKGVKEYYNLMSSVLSYPKMKVFNKRELFYTFFFPEGSLNVVSKNDLSEEDCRLMTRFAKAFGMIYRRFLDLQKAEAQARDAQIEVALERVRSRTMAMHKSDELSETAAVLFEQLSGLGIDALRLYIGIIEDESGEIEFWTTDYGGNQVSSKYKASLFGSATFRKIYSGWNEKRKSLVVDPKGKELTEHLHYLKEIMGYPIKDRKTLNRRLQTIAYFSKGLIGVLSNEELPKESVILLVRFASVFDLTYRRFLDLQKAEAQAREAQIEVSLERVRSRTMAMHNSNELQEAAVLLFHQIKDLGVETGSCGYVIWEKKKKDATFWMSSAEGEIQEPFSIPYTKSKIYREVYSAEESGKDFFVKEVKGAELKKHFDYLSTVPGIGEKIIQLRKARYKFPEKIIYNIAFFRQGYLSFHTHEYSPEANDIFKRFASVFEQTYTRFLDLQKAEAQAREAQIEASLEKIRNRSLAMHNAEELGEVISVVVEKLKELNFSVDDGVALITHIEGSKDLLEWMVNPGFPSAIKFYLPYFEHPVLSDLWKAKNEGSEFIAKRYTAKENRSFLNHIFKHSDFKHTPQPIKDYCLAANTYATSIAFQKNTAIFINDYSGKTLTQLEIDILKRFSKVFEQAYIRFLDLQKAEAQAREAYIETALERVRSRSMGMQKSEELKEVIKIVYQQLRLLNINLDHAGFVVDYTPKGDWHFWIADEQDIPAKISHPWFESVWANQFNEAKEKGDGFFATYLDFQEKNKFYSELLSYVPGLPEASRDFYLNCPGLAATTVLFDSVSLYIENFSGIPYTDEENKILIRFGKVFQQTYTRFKDLKQAEAQAREAQIEAALEKVRGKAMAMHNSNDLTEAAGQVFTELNNLGIKPIRSGFVLLTKESHIAKLYPATSFDNKNTVSFTGEFEFTGHPVYEKQYEIWEKKENYFPVLEGDLLKSYYKILAKGLSVPYENFPTDEKQFGTFLPFSEGFLFTWSNEPYSENEVNILDRFKNILDLTIRRYIDLKNAEAQSRESQIEASLERVRSKAMAMQKSEDLGEAVTTIFEELEKLNLGTIRCGIGIINKEKKSVDVWATTISDNEKIVQISGDESMDIHPLLRGAFDAWLKQEDFSYLLQGEDLINYYKSQIQSNFKLPDSQSIITDDVMLKQYYYVATFQSGGLFAFRESIFPEEAKTVIKRFADVINFTYTRFNDLKLAEAQSMEARIEAALERVRSRTLAMQKSDELAETAAVVFKQLISLGIEPNRLYIGIINDDSGDIEAWATDEDGSKVSKEFTLNIYENASVKKMYDGWAARINSIIIDMKGDELQSYLHYIGEVLHVPFKGGLSQERRVQNIAYFSKGFIGMASPDPQPEETAILLERFAAVFNLTFTRFNDLQIAEKHAEQAEIDLIKLQTEKKRAEEALNELRSTQAQLIQSEKMASLGELTAGIAHEIQNPLNFVNNFSEVNTELIDELNEELSKGNFEDAIQLAKDIKDNEEKIKHHGKRAEGIVKGMLQHSRTSSGVKEPTNINNLSDEYLRLAYHGLRAKDKTFNARMETDFDESVGNVNIISQDIGRVILNLITNAFYSVTVKKKEEIKGYEPTVTVSTKKSGENILISVKDNGNGIPQKIMDKIFQPFFTTKPTGQGTGLGLSMSYDIIKAHGGELKVETKEGEGSEFVIVLKII